MGREERVIVVEPLASPVGADQIAEDVDRVEDEITTSWIPAPSDPGWVTAPVPDPGSS